MYRTADGDTIYKEVIMKDEHRLYIQMLRAFVNGSAPDLGENPDLQKLMEFAAINNTRGMLGYVIMSNPTLFPKEFVGLMRHMCLNEITIYAQRAGYMDDQVRRMNEAGIDHLLFKGYVVRNYYPVPELRTYGDVDFVIRTTDREKSNRLMLDQGFEPHYDWEPVYDYTRGVEYYEIHTDVMEIDVSDKADFVGYYSHIWDHVFRPDPEGMPHTYQFTPEFHLIYLLTHIAKHISSSGAGIRMYLDIAFYLKHFDGQLDWDWIRSQCEILHFEDFANLTFTAVEQWFGVPSPIPLRPISEETLDDFLTFTLEGGLFGRANKDEATIMLKKQDRSDDQEVSKTRTLLFHIFPPVASLKFRYPFLDKHPWLLPWAWLRRILDNRSSWGRYLDSTKAIVGADTDEALRLKKLYKEIGL